MLLIASLAYFVKLGVTSVIVAATVLILLRVLLNNANVNPFSRTAIAIRRATDPVLLPVRRSLVALRVDARAAPLVAILLIILVGWFIYQLLFTLLATVAGVLGAITSGRPIAVFGHLLYGFLGFYSLLIFIRIIFMWFSMGHGNPVMRFLIGATEPLLAPLRRTIPPVGMFDISPIVAFLLIWLLQAAVAGTLL
jgi:YggT family protein